MRLRCQPTTQRPTPIHPWALPLRVVQIKLFTASSSLIRSPLLLNVKLYVPNTCVCTPYFSYQLVGEFLALALKHDDTELRIRARTEERCNLFSTPTSCTWQRLSAKPTSPPHKIWFPVNYSIHSHASVQYSEYLNPFILYPIG
jgi:hypothetical protein